MKNSISKLASISFFLFVASIQNLSAQTVAPKDGWLIIHGGGEVSAGTKQRFIELAGGPNAHIILIPTAISDDELESLGFLRGQGKGWARTWGLNHVTMLHSRDKETANSAHFADELRKATGVWILGGRQWRLADAYLDTAVEQGIKDLLARGGVVGGSSAGAKIQGSFLVRGDPRSNEIMISRGHEQGFGLLSNSAIDQHVDTRGREFDLLKVIKLHPELLGFGIDEGAAMIVHGDIVKAVDGRVTIYDSNPTKGPFSFSLEPEATFHLSCAHATAACP